MRDDIIGAMHAVVEASGLHDVGHWSEVKALRYDFSKAPRGTAEFSVHLTTRDESVTIVVARNGERVGDVPAHDGPGGPRRVFTVGRMKVVELATALDAIRAEAFRAIGGYSRSPDMDRLDSMLRAGVAVGRHLTNATVADVFDTHSLREDLVEEMERRVRAPSPR